MNNYMSLELAHRLTPSSETPLDYHKYGHAVDTSDCEYFRLDINLVVP